MKFWSTLLIALLLSGPALAVDDPIKITSDKFVVDDEQQIATFTGKVVILRTNLTVWAAKVVVDYGDGGPSSIKSLVATGNVRIKTNEQDATGDRADYDPKTSILKLSGNVMVVNSTGTVGSPDLVVNLDTNNSVFTSAGGKRVTGVFSTK